mmetsp:Transcript_59998/g.168149  ORF Transcript_59998/g.168149 Transcript_59998/m.168149 type:complete len:247 (+) Transcript_59998:380-1120(+)
MLLRLDRNDLGQHGIHVHCRVRGSDDTGCHRDIHLPSLRRLLGSQAVRLPLGWCGPRRLGHHARVLEHLHQPCGGEHRRAGILGNEEDVRHLPLHRRPDLPGVDARLRGENHEPVHRPAAPRRGHGGPLWHLVRHGLARRPQRVQHREHASRPLPVAALNAVALGGCGLDLLHRHLQLLGRHRDAARVRRLSLDHRRIPHDPHLGCGVGGGLEHLQRAPTHRLHRRRNGHVDLQPAPRHPGARAYQ